MPVAYDRPGGGATTRAPKVKPKRVKRKPPLIAPQIKRRPSSSRAVTHVPGLGAVTRPATPKVTRPTPLTRPMRPSQIGGIRVQARPEPPKRKRKTQVIAGPRGMSVEHVEGRSTGEILESLARPAPRKRTMVVAGPRGMSVSRQSATPGGSMLVTALRNAPKDFGELVITTPSSLYALGETAATHPERLPGELVKPYVDLVKDPVKAFSEHPVSTALMVAPSVKVPARTAGRVAAATGKRSLATEPATLEGTSLRAQRWRSPDLVDDALAKRSPRRSRRPKGAHVTEREIDQRVDEAYDAAQLHKQAVASSAGREANRRFGSLPKHERDVAIQEHLSGAAGGAAQEATRRFAREFGSHWYIDAKTGALIKPKRPAENAGRLHERRADAERIGERLPFDASVITVASPSATHYAAVPTRAAERWSHHQRIGNSNATGAVVMRTGTRQFRRTVLPMSTKWLGGQVAEAALRSAVMGAGPTSFLRARRILARLPERERRELINRTTGGGQFGVTGPAAEFAHQAPTLAEEFAPTGLARPAEIATRVGATPGIRHLRKGYQAYTNVVFNHVNGTVERLAKTAQLGKAIKQSPLMEKRMLGLSNQAVEEAAQGLRNTSTMTELGRALDRSYGKYSKHGPHMRETLMHSTPFIPWFIAMGKFLTNVMPKDHPVLTALAADLTQAEQDWREAHELSLHGEHVPDFMLGSAPVGGKYVPLGRYGPFLPGEYTSSVGGQLWPAFTGMLQNASGVDWTGRQLEGWAGSQPGLAANAALTGASALIPGVSQLDRITGLGAHYVRGQEDKPSVVQGKDVRQALLDLLNPLKAIGDSSADAAEFEGVDPGTDLVDVPFFDPDNPEIPDDREPDAEPIETPVPVKPEPRPTPRASTTVTKRRTPKGASVVKRTTVKAPSGRAVKQRKLYSWPSDPKGKPARHTIPWHEHQRHLTAWHRARSSHALR